MRNWLLPEHIEDILPTQALQIERLRAAVLKLFRGHGYQLVVPPLLEYLESLLVGSGHDLDLSTFKLVDQLSGRTLGLRADITPQVARIDAHLLNREGVTRLCYAGSVVHTLPGDSRTREPLLIGAELYGHAGIESDLEIQRLMLRALELAEVGKVHLDIGHVGIFRALARAAALPSELEDEIFRALQSKDLPGLRGLTSNMEPVLENALLRLPELYGGAEVLAEARRSLPVLPDIERALTDLESLAKLLPGGALDVGFDLAELRGYRYHSAVVFAAYVPGCPHAVARGGRYDEVGQAFGRARPATGFSLDLRELTGLLPALPLAKGIRAPYLEDAALQAMIEALRANGEIVLVDLPGSGRAQGELDCDRKLVLRAGAWQVAQLGEH